jgi:hypothetical protein
MAAEVQTHPAAIVTLGGMSAEAKNLEAISKAIDQHNATCEWPAVAVLMNPFEVERLGWDSIRGLPVRPEPSMGTGSFRILCSKEEGVPEEEIVEAVSETPVFVNN